MLNYSIFECHISINNYCCRIKKITHNILLLSIRFIITLLLNYNDLDDTCFLLTLLFLYTFYNQKKKQFSITFSPRNTENY